MRSIRATGVRLKSLRQRAIIPFAAFGVFLMLYSVAWACTVQKGSTYWCPQGTIKDASPKTVAPNTNVCAWGEQAQPRSLQQLIRGTQLTDDHKCMDKVEIINANASSDNSGTIGETTGVVAVLGTYDMCFVTPDLVWSTAGIPVTVT